MSLHPQILQLPTFISEWSQFKTNICFTFKQTGAGYVCIFHLGKGKCYLSEEQFSCNVVFCIRKFIFRIFHIAAEVCS